MYNVHLASKFNYSYSTVQTLQTRFNDRHVLNFIVCLERFNQFIFPLRKRSVRRASSSRERCYCKVSSEQFSNIVQTPIFINLYSRINKHLHITFSLSNMLILFIFYSSYVFTKKVICIYNCNSCHCFTTFKISEYKFKMWHFLTQVELP